MTVSLPIVGRDREIALLREALDSALEGRHGSVALISGAAGIGKTTLAEMICDQGRQRGALVLVGRCYDLTETAPFAPWFEIFSSYPGEGSLPEIPHSLARFEIADDTSSQAVLFARIQRFLADIAQQRPLVLLLDDQHWADDASLDLFRFLARQASNLPLLMLFTYRPGELQSQDHLTQLLPLVAREARALRLHLRELSSDDLWAIVRPRYQLGVGDEARLTSYLYDRTEGNPFFTVELLQTLEEQEVLWSTSSGWTLGDLNSAHTPILIEQIIGARLAHLNDEDQQLLAIAAVLGQEVSLSLWREVAETDQESLLDLLDRAGQARLMSELPDGRGARFVHALVRHVIYNRLAPSRRRLWHRRAGTAIAAAARHDPDAVANHFRRAGDPRAAEWLIRAGERAERAYSWQTAAERFEASMAVLSDTGNDAGTQGWLLVRIARMRRYAAPHIGLERLEEAGRIANTTGDRPLAATVFWQSGLLNCLLGNIQHGIELLERGTAAFDDLQPFEHDQLVASQSITGFVPDIYHDRGALSLWLGVSGRYADAIGYAEPYATDETVEAGAAGSYGDAYSSLGVAHAMLGNPDESRAAFARAGATYQGDRYDVHLARMLVNEFQLRVLPYEADNLTERRRFIADAEAAWKRGRGAHADEFAGAPRMPLDFLEGHWTEMRETALALRDSGTSALRAEASNWLGLLARAQGDTVLAWELVEEWLPAGPASTPGDTFFVTAQAMQRLAANLAIDAGDLPTARRWLDACDRWLDWSGAVIGRAENAITWAAYHRANADAVLSRQKLAAALDLASTPRQPLALCVANRMLGELDTTDGRYSEAEHSLNAALTLADACAAQYEQALTLLALVDLDIQRNNASVAKARLATASSILERLEAKPALARAVALADRLHRGAENPVEGDKQAMREIASEQDEALLATLTAREIDVLRLLPAGHTNQEIADALFLSPKTIENHIGRILAKTELPNRAAAAAFAQRAGIA